MTRRTGVGASRWLLAGMLLLYPLAVYLLLDRLGAGVLGILLIVLLALRLNSVTDLLPGRAYFIGIAIVLAGAVTVLGGGTLALKSYPTIISLILLAVFGYTLLVPPSMVERIARIAGSEISDRIISYTRKVTIVWCIFFAANAFVSAWISVAGSIEAWAFYNGFFAYLIVGALFATELVIRYFYKRHYRISTGVR
ncbi:MAG: hypothetical protein OER85_04185 [Gammaproteobacteria bacterium]|nr:hypothetical protein [Gammaproteobacteria bacterium]